MHLAVDAQNCELASWNAAEQSVDSSDAGFDSRVQVSWRDPLLESGFEVAEQRVEGVDDRNDAEVVHCDTAESSTGRDWSRRSCIVSSRQLWGGATGAAPQAEYISVLGIS